MNNKMIPQHASACVLYDEHGRIVHTHVVYTFEGGKRVDEDEIERRARDRAGRLGHATDGLHALHADPAHLQKGEHIVDVATKVLKPAPVTRRPLPKQRPAKR